MNYKEYQNARDAVWRLLIDLRISELPVNTVKVCAELEIKLHYYEPTDESDGMSCYINGMPHIYVSSEVSPERRRFTIAHELGHIILGHVGKYELVNREPSPGDNPVEQAANVFASRLLSPACVLWGAMFGLPSKYKSFARSAKQPPNTECREWKNFTNAIAF